MSTYLNVSLGGLIDYSGITLDPQPTYKAFAFEIVDWRSVVQWMHKFWFIPHLVGLLYIGVIFGLRAYLRDKKALRSDKALALWNAGLGLFSAIGFARIAPQFFEELVYEESGVHSAICYG
jgi:hypothetical protein